ncbi:hypothetical protein MCEMSEM23_01755 [Rhabdaerophilaceae bacterium]
MKSWRLPSSDNKRPWQPAFLAAFLFLASLQIGNAQVLGQAAVSVDIQGASAIAAHVRRAMPAYLQKALLAARISGYPTDARLIVTVTEVYLSHDGGSPFANGGDDAMTMPDGITGAMRVVDSRGSVLFQRRLVVALPPGSSGNGLSPSNEPRRVDALIEAMADWAVRYARR